MMVQRKFGKLDIRVSPFGMGCMRLPEKDGAPDEAEVARMIHHAIENGVNYFDTAFGYHGGKSEVAVGKALAGPWRKRAYLATKLPHWNCNEAADMPRIFDTQLERLQTDYVDFYLVHSIESESWKKMKDLGVIDFLDRLKAEGRIKYVGFSYHGNEQDFPGVIDEYDWDMCQLQFNYMDINNQATLSGVRYAGKKGVPVVVMEGLLGGKLANVPSDIAAIWDESPTRRSSAEWAFRWLVDFPEVAVVLSGVSNMEQLDDDIRIFQSLDSGNMSEAEHDMIARVREAFQKRIAVPCTSCEYCMPCPYGVKIPQLFSLWNESKRYDTWESSEWQYGRIVSDGNGPDKCVACRACEALCPQSIEISARMAELQEIGPRK